jgi:hypothetical protein
MATGKCSRFKGLYNTAALELLNTTLPSLSSVNRG